MPAVRTVLVIGAGLAGCATAIRLAEAGVAVDLVEITPEIRVLGSGITLQGNALRALRRLGVYDEMESAGFAFDGLGLRAPDADGTLLAEIPDTRMGGPDLPATMGVERLFLAATLIDRAAKVGATVRFGTSAAAFEQRPDGVTVTFADGRRERYDLVVAADGVRSATRRSFGIELEPQPTGLAMWRASGPRPASVTRTELFYGGPSYLAGYCPTGVTSLYAYVVDDAQDRSALTPAQRLATMRELTGPYHGPWDEIRDGLTDPELVHHTRFEAHLLEPPWHRGRVVLIGDAAHGCPPTMAQGGAQALEDALVLTELLIARSTVDDELFAAFLDRRFDRARVVVEAGLQVGRWLLDHDPRADVPGLMRRLSALVVRPS